MELSRRQLLYGAGALGAAAALPSEAAMVADPAPGFRLLVQDLGPVLRHGDGPDRCDALGAREASVFTDPLQPSRLFMHYDGAGPRGWLACLAESTDGGASWVKRGPVLRLGSNPAYDGASASSPWVLRDLTGRWHMWYLGARSATAAPRRIPMAPYATMYATSSSPRGPWTQTGQVALTKQPGTWCSRSASPGPVRFYRGEYLMHFSGAGASGMSIGLARASSLTGPWRVDPQPLLPVTQRLENAAVSFDPVTGLWWLLADHIGAAKGSDGLTYTDAVWAYWSRTPTAFTVSQSAVAFDATSCGWSRVVGMPSLHRGLDGLTLYYDGADGALRTDHMARDIGRARLTLPSLPDVLTGKLPVR